MSIRLKFGDISVKKRLSLKAEELFRFIGDEHKRRKGKLKKINFEVAKKALNIDDDDTFWSLTHEIYSRWYDDVLDTNYPKYSLGISPKPPHFYLYITERTLIHYNEYFDHNYCPKCKKRKKIIRYCGNPKCEDFHDKD